MGGLLGGKSESVSRNPEWLDKAGEELYSLGKSFVFNPSKKKAGGTTSGVTTASSVAPTNQGVQSSLFQPPKSRTGGVTTASAAYPSGGDEESDMSFDNIRGLPMYMDERYASLDPSMQAADDYASAYAKANKGFSTARNYLKDSTAGYGQTFDPRTVTADQVNAMMVDTSTFGQDDLDQFLNPYIKTALQTTSDEMARQADVDRLRQNSGMVSKGAFGGSRQAIEDSELTRNLLDRTGAMFKTGMSEGYDRALSNYMQEAARKLQAKTSNQGAKLSADQGNQGSNLDAAKFTESNRLAAFNANRDQFNTEKNRLQSAASGMGNLASTESNAASQDVERLLRTGGTKQAQKQNLLDFAYQQFQEQRDWPYKQLERLSGIVSGSPSQGAMQVVEKSNPLASIAGLGLSLATGMPAGGGGSLPWQAAGNVNPLGGYYS